MHTYILLGAVLIFILSGITDWKKREVADVLSIAAWLLCLDGDTRLLVTVFLACWAVAEVALQLNKFIVKDGKKHNPIGWADVLMVPPFFVLVTEMYSFLFTVLLLCAILVTSQVWMSRQTKKTGIPMVAFLAIGLVISALMKLFF